MTSRNYTIRIRGEFGRRHRFAFEDLHVSISNGHTVLRGTLPDRAALYGVFRRVEDLGLEIISIDSEVAHSE